MSQRDEHKAMARGFRAALEERGIQLSHGECLDLVSRASGFKSWNVLSARLTVEEGPPGDEHCDFCGLTDAYGSRLFSGPFSGAICLRCAEDFVEAAHHGKQMDERGRVATLLAGKTAVELERYSRVVTRRIAAKERSIEQMNAFLAGRPSETVGLQPGNETMRWAALATRARAKVEAHRDAQVVELKRSRAAQTLVMEVLQGRSP